MLRFREPRIVGLTIDGRPIDWGKPFLANLQGERYVRSMAGDGRSGFYRIEPGSARFLRGRKVRVVDNFLTGFRENIEEVMGDIEFVEGDIRNPAVCRKACQGASIVFHQAAVPSVPRSMNDPETCLHVNLAGPHNMLMAARDAGVGRFMFAASSSAYGASEELPKRESMAVIPLSPYAAAKAAGELYVTTFSKAYGLGSVNLRYFNVFGPRQDPTNQYAGVIAAFASRMIRGQPPIIYGDGKQSRDFTFVENVVHANLLAAEAATALTATW